MLPEEPAITFFSDVSKGAVNPDLFEEGENKANIDLVRKFFIWCVINVVHPGPDAAP